MAKKICTVVKTCLECPYYWLEDEHDPMGGNGWHRCKMLPGVCLGDRGAIANTIYEECPLEDA